MSLRQHVGRTSHRARAGSLGRALPLLTLVTALMGGCGDDDDETAAERVSAACDASCGRVAQGCGLETPAAGCAAACEIGGALSPDCVGQYEGFLDCASESPPLVACDDDSVVITASASTCVDPLVDYLSCAAQATVPACLDAPLESAECDAMGLGSRAVVCVGQPEGCTLFEGSLRAEGAGLFCCP